MARRCILALGSLVAVVVVLLIAPAAQAQYGRGWIMTPYGPMNTRSPEYRMSGGNPEMYFSLKMQGGQQKTAMQNYKQFQQQQQQAQKQRQAFEKWYKEQKAKKEKGEKTDPKFDELEKQREVAEKAAADAEAWKLLTPKQKTEKLREMRKEKLEAKKKAATSKAKKTEKDGTPKDQPKTGEDSDSR